MFLKERGLRERQRGYCGECTGTWLRQMGDWPPVLEPGGFARWLEAEIRLGFWDRVMGPAAEAIRPMGRLLLYLGTGF